MRFFQPSQDRDLELLSAYLDDALAAGERAALERRLKAEPGLRQSLAGLRRVQTALHAAPAVKLPRSFTLTPVMAGRTARQPAAARFIPVLNLATSIAAVMFAVVIGSQLATSKPAAPTADTQVSALAQSAPAEAPIAPKSVTGTPAVTDHPTTVLQGPPCDANQEPLTGGGCSGGGGAGSPNAGSVGAPYAPLAGTSTDGAIKPSIAVGLAGASADGTTGPSVAPGLAASTSPAESATAETPGSVRAANDNATTEVATDVPTEAATDLLPAPALTSDPFGATASAPANTETAATSPARLLIYALGGLLLLLIVASIIVRRQ